MTALRATDLIRDAIVSLANSDRLRGNYLADDDRIAAAQSDIEHQATFDHDDLGPHQGATGAWCDHCEHIARTNLADAEAGR